MVLPWAAMLLAWLKAFLLTIGIECPIAALVLRPRDFGMPRLVALVAFANLATHPLVWFVFPALPVAPLAALVMSELWAFGAEALFFALAFRVSTARAVSASLLANGASLGVGLALYRWLGAWMLG